MSCSPFAGGSTGCIQGAKPQGGNVRVPLLCALLRLIWLQPLRWLCLCPQVMGRSRCRHEIAGLSSWISKLSSAHTRQLHSAKQHYACILIRNPRSRLLNIRHCLGLLIKKKKKRRSILRQCPYSLVTTNP